MSILAFWYVKICTHPKIAATVFLCFFRTFILPQVEKMVPCLEPGQVSRTPLADIWNSILYDYWDEVIKGDAAFALFSLRTIPLGTQPPCCEEAQITCRNPLREEAKFPGPQHKLSLLASTNWPAKYEWTILEMDHLIQLPTWWCMKQKQDFLPNLFPNRKFVGGINSCWCLSSPTPSCYLCLRLFHTMFIQRCLFYFIQQEAPGLDTWKSILKKRDRA